MQYRTHQPKSAAYKYKTTWFVFNVFNMYQLVHDVYGKELHARLWSTASYNKWFYCWSRKTNWMNMDMMSFPFIPKINRSSFRNCQYYVQGHITLPA